MTQSLCGSAACKALDDAIIASRQRARRSFSDATNDGHCSQAHCHRRLRSAGAAGDVVRYAESSRRVSTSVNSTIRGNDGPASNSRSVEWQTTGIGSSSPSAAGSKPLFVPRAGGADASCEEGGAWEAEPGVKPDACPHSRALASETIHPATRARTRGVRFDRQFMACRSKAEVHGTCQSVPGTARHVPCTRGLKAGTRIELLKFK